VSYVEIIEWGRKLLTRDLPIRLLFIWLFMGGWFATLTGASSIPQSYDAIEEGADTITPRINAPYNVPGHEAAIFWFGQVTSSDNYADVRVGYRDAHVFVHVNIMDRRLWYDETPSPDELTEWDAVSLYLNVPDAGGASSADSYRFDAQLVWWGDRSAYQAAYRNEAGTWLFADVPFTTDSSWSGDVPNTNIDDRGWSLLYNIPYASLGLNGTPARGTVWGMALVLHDRDAAGGPVLPTQTWPETMSPADPDTWGELVFGAPLPYDPLPAVPGGTLTIRHGLNNAVVVDADVGGSSVCGELAAPDYFPTWGELNYVGKEFINIQNLGHISEWPCFSKYYITFPLDALPPGKVILSAYLTLYQFGNAGQGATPGPQPSLIQVSTIDQVWDEASITWNTAPLPTQNITTAWVDPLATPPPHPGIPREWDVSAAVAEAYASGDPARLVLYSPAWDFHSGKYFRSSDFGITGEGRPTLAIHWGEPVAQLTKEANKGGANYGDTIQYTLKFNGVGATIRVTDTLPNVVEWMNDVEVYGTNTAPVYDPVQHRLLWEGSPVAGEQVRLTYTGTVATFSRQLIVNAAELLGEEGSASSATVIVIANPLRCYLPLVLRL